MPNGNGILKHLSEMSKRDIFIGMDDRDLLYDF